MRMGRAKMGLYGDAATGIFDGEVANFAALPAMPDASYSGDWYLCNASQGSRILFTYKPDGPYYCDGTSWTSHALNTIATLAEDTTPELGGDLDALTYHIGFTQQTVTYNSGTTTVDWGAGNKASMTFGAGNITTFAFTNPPKPSSLTLMVIQDATGSRTVTGWDADIKWVGGSAPTLSTGANAVDIISFYWNGTNYHGAASLDFS